VTTRYKPVLYRALNIVLWSHVLESLFLRLHERIQSKEVSHRKAGSFEQALWYSVWGWVNAVLI